MHTWTRLVPAVLLAVLFAPVPLRAADAETNAKAIARLQQDVKNLQNDMVAQSLSRIQIQSQLNEILARLDHLAAQQDKAIQRISAYGPTAGVPGGAPPTTGMITLENQYNARAAVVINGQVYPIEPFRTIQVPGIATGSFEYSVDVEGRGLIQPPRRDTLTPFGYRIRIYPLR